MPSDKYWSQNFYDMYNTKQYKLKLNVNTDADIIEWLESQNYTKKTTKQGAIKALIRKEIQAEMALK